MQTGKANKQKSQKSEKSKMVNQTKTANSSKPQSESEIVAELNKRNQLTIELSGEFNGFTNKKLMNILPELSSCKFIFKKYSKIIIAVSVEFDSEDKMAAALAKIEAKSGLSVKDFKRAALTDLSAYEKTKLVVNNVPSSVCEDASKESGDNNHAALRKLFPNATGIVVRQNGLAKAPQNNENQVVDLQYPNFQAASRDFLEKNGTQVDGQKIQVLFKKLPMPLNGKRNANKKGGEANEKPMKMEKQRKRKMSEEMEVEAENDKAETSVTAKPIAKPKLKAKKARMSKNASQTQQND